MAWNLLYTFKIKTTAADESLHMFEQTNNNFSTTLARLERENSVLKVPKRAAKIEIKNTLLTMRVYNE